MAISVFPAPSATTAGDNWVQIATATPTSGSSVSFTSIPTNYKKLWLISDGITLSTSAIFTITINSITGAADYRFARGGPTSTQYITIRDEAGLFLSGSTFVNLNLIFENPGFGLPFVTFSGYQSQSSSEGVQYRLGNVIAATAAITQIDSTLSTGDFTTNTGTIYLYGTE